MYNKLFKKIKNKLQWNFKKLSKCKQSVHDGKRAILNENKKLQNELKFGGKCNLKQFNNNYYY